MNLIPPLMFLCLIVGLLAGMPVAFALAGTGMLFAGLGMLQGWYAGPELLLGVAENIFYVCVQTETLTAVPLFILMGMILERSGIAGELLGGVGQLFGRRRGGLAIGVVLLGALLAASTGIVGATVVTMAVLTLPAMMQQGYCQRLSCGTIAAAGTLGQIIPPSIVLILLANQMQLGVGELFVGSLIPGLLLVAAYIAYLSLRLHLQPHLAPAPEAAPAPLPWSRVLALLAPPLLLMLVVLGSIMAGVATPTESAACGAAGAMLLAWSRRSLPLPQLWAAAQQTVWLTAMVFTILAGAQFFSQVFALASGPEWIGGIFIGEAADPFAPVGTPPGGILGSVAGENAGIAVAMIMLLIFILGFFLDFLEICFIVLPIILPILVPFGYHIDGGDAMLVLAVMIALNLQTSFLTPPFGFALFYLKGAAPPGLSSATIYRGVMPYVCIQLLVLGAVALWPALVTWLPSLVFR